MCCRTLTRLLFTTLSLHILKVREVCYRRLEVAAEVILYFANEPGELHVPFAD